LPPLILESPYAGNVEENVAYARAAVRDSLLRGESPIASHLLYTQPGILEDSVPDERQLGVEAGLAWRFVVEASVIYQDLGITPGMRRGIEAAETAGVPVEYRNLASFRTQKGRAASSRAPPGRRGDPRCRLGSKSNRVLAPMGALPCQDDAVHGRNAQHRTFADLANVANRP
jgi:hypothetical protein